MTLKIPYGLAIVTGPMATGKTTLAKRILGECPRMNKRLLTFPEILLDKSSSCRLSGDSELRTRLNYMYAIEQAYKDGMLAVCDGCYLNGLELSSFLYRLRAMRIYYNVTLIKMAPKAELQEKFIAESQRTNFRPEMVAKQKREFGDALKRSFQEEIGWVKSEYIVKDPESVEIIFL